MNRVSWNRPNVDFAGSGDSDDEESDEEDDEEGEGEGDSGGEDEGPAVMMRRGSTHISVASTENDVEALRKSTVYF